MPSSEHPKVFVILVNWKGWDDTKMCLESLQELTEIVDDRLVYYNERRRHSELQYQPPIIALERHLNTGGGAPSRTQ